MRYIFLLFLLVAALPAQGQPSEQDIRDFFANPSWRSLAIGPRVFDLFWQKDDFETTSQFRARMQRDIDSVLGRGVAFRVAISNTDLQARYDSDRKGYVISKPSVRTDLKIYGEGISGFSTKYYMNLFDGNPETGEYLSPSTGDSIKTIDTRLKGLVFSDGHSAIYRSSDFVPVALDVARRARRSVAQALVFSTESARGLYGRNEILPTRTWHYYITERAYLIEVTPIAFVLFNSDTGELMALEMLPRQ